MHLVLYEAMSAERAKEGLRQLIKRGLPAATVLLTVGACDVGPKLEYDPTTERVLAKMIQPELHAMGKMILDEEQQHPSNFSIRQRLDGSFQIKGVNIREEFRFASVQASMGEKDGLPDPQQTSFVIGEEDTYVGKNSLEKKVILASTAGLEEARELAVFAGLQNGYTYENIGYGESIRTDDGMLDQPSVIFNTTNKKQFAGDDAYRLTDPVTTATEITRLAEEIVPEAVTVVGFDH